jgi:exopolysaccharide biosynthesis polyprenyl glycosylphosphotransferase
VRKDVRFAPLLAGPAGRGTLRRGLSVLVLLAIDVTSVFLGLYAALAFKLIVLGRPVDSGAIWAVEQKGLPIAALTLVLVFAKNGLYTVRESRAGAAKVLASVTVSTLIVAAVVLAAGWEVTTYYIFYSSWFLVSVCVLALRASYASVTAFVLEKLEFERRVLLVGTPEAVDKVADSLERARLDRPSVRYRVVGRHGLPEGLGAERVTGPAKVLSDALDPATTDEVIITGVTGEGADKAVVDLLEACRRRGIPVRLAPTTVELLSHSVRAVPAPGLPLFELRPPVLSGASFYAKRAFDLVMGALLLVVLGPFLAIAALAVKLYDRGPVLHRSRRVGVDESVFTCLKLRTMRVDAEAEQEHLEAANEADGALFKIRRDPRVTPVGRLLRRFSIDELPQLVNVLRGEMSLVGPRPLPVRDFERLDDLHKKRYLVLPGMTGLWQVSGRSELTFDDLVRLDFYYIESWSIWLDLSILLRTVPAVIGRHGAW